jgi:hypothetical protein
MPTLRTYVCCRLHVADGNAMSFGMTCFELTDGWYLEYGNCQNLHLVCGPFSKSTPRERFVSSLESRIACALIPCHSSLPVVVLFIVQKQRHG